MNSEDIIHAAHIMDSAAETNCRAAEQISESVNQLQLLLGQGYGNNLELLIEQLTKLNERPV